MSRDVVLSVFLLSCHCRLGMALLELKDLDSCRKHLIIIRDSTQRSRNKHLQRKYAELDGRLQFASYEYEDAHEIFQSILPPLSETDKLLETTLEIRLYASLCLLYLQRFSEALTSLRVFRNVPTPTRMTELTRVMRGKFYLAVAFVARGDFDNGRKLFTEILPFFQPRLVSSNDSTARLILRYLTFIDGCSSSGLAQVSSDLGLASVEDCWDVAACHFFVAHGLLTQGKNPAAACGLLRDALIDWEMTSRLPSRVIIDAKIRITAFLATYGNNLEAVEFGRDTLEGLEQLHGRKSHVECRRMRLLLGSIYYAFGDLEVASTMLLETYTLVCIPPPSQEKPPGKPPECYRWPFTGHQACSVLRLWASGKVGDATDLIKRLCEPGATNRNQSNMFAKRLITDMERDLRPWAAYRILMGKLLATESTKQQLPRPGKMHLPIHSVQENVTEPVVVERSSSLPALDSGQNTCAKIITYQQESTKTSPSSSSKTSAKKQRPSLKPKPAHLRSNA